jgi:hypothetical protein
MKAGDKFEPVKGYSNIIGNFDVQFRPMHPSHYCDWELCLLFYDNDPKTFPALQCFCPDMHGKFPWQRGCEKWTIDQQPFTISPTQPT